MVCAFALALPAASSAAPGQQALIQDDDQFLYNGAERADDSLDQVVDLGVEWVRVSIHWGNVAPARRSRLRDPTNPAEYQDAEFDGVDHLLRAAAKRNLGVLLTVTGPAPRWAARTRRDKAVFKPSPRAYGQFVEMLGKRWSGTYRDENQGGGVLPAVRVWSLWNEPNWQTSLLPQWVGPPHARRPYAGIHYRKLYRAAVAGLGRAGHADDAVLLGETAPMGSSLNTNRSPLKPGVFLRQVFCIRRDGSPLRGRRARRNQCDFARKGPLKAFAYAHHPYPIMSPPAEGHPEADRFKLGDTPELVQLLDRAAAAGRIPARLPLWFTEFGWQTKPDPVRGIGLRRHARWLGEAERYSYEQPRVAVHGNFLLRDDEPRTFEPAGSGEYWATWQSGLLTSDGAKKPAYDAFRLPLVAPRQVPAGSPLDLWGVVRPAPHDVPANVVVQRREGGRWDNVLKLSVPDPRSAFTASVPDPRPGVYRFQWRPRAPEPGDRGFLIFRPKPPPAPDPVASAPVAVGVG